MRTLLQIPAALLALVLVATGCASQREGVAADATTEATSTRTTPAGARQRFVFLAPFDELAAADSAQWDSLDHVYAPLNYVVTGSACRPSEPARDRLNRRGWSQVDCTLTVTGKNGDRCDIEVWDAEHRWWSPEGIGRCTGTIWQSVDKNDGHLIADTGARRARFHVTLRLNQRTGYVSARISQLPPFAPRLKTFPSQ